jgi:phosphatidylglycerophosphate synthase
MFHVKHRIESQDQFVVDLLTTLRQDKFGLIGWRRFLWRSWQMSCRTANENTTLKQSWMRFTLWIGVFTIAIIGGNIFFEGIGPTLRLLPGLLFCMCWQQSDLFWHLGLNRQVRSGQLLSTIGLANAFTWLRGMGASYLLGRLIGGLNTPSWLALLIFLYGIVTDILDGQIARRTNTQSKLGQIADGEADFCLYLAITIILIQNAVLPLWLSLVMLLRFCIPLLAALGSYFLFAHPVRFGSTFWGKYAGLAQCLYFLVLLAPPQLAFIARYINLPLLVVTLFLLIAAPIAQIIGNVWCQVKAT